MGYEIIREQLVHTDRGDMDLEAVGASYYAIVYAKDAPHLGMLKVRLGANSETVTIGVEQRTEEDEEPMIPLAELRAAIDELEFTVYPERRGRQPAAIPDGEDEEPKDSRCTCPDGFVAEDCPVHSKGGRG